MRPYGSKPFFLSLLKLKLRVLSNSNIESKFCQFWPLRSAFLHIPINREYSWRKLLTFHHYKVQYHHDSILKDSLCYHAYDTMVWNHYRLRLHYSGLYSSGYELRDDNPYKCHFLCRNCYAKLTRMLPFHRMAITCLLSRLCTKYTKYWRFGHSLHKNLRNEFDPVVNVEGLFQASENLHFRTCNNSLKHIRRAILISIFFQGIVWGIKFKILFFDLIVVFG